MADKGLTMRGNLPEGVLLNILSFLVNGQLTQGEVNTNRLIPMCLDTRGAFHSEAEIVMHFGPQTIGIRVTYKNNQTPCSQQVLQFLKISLQSF